MATEKGAIVGIDLGTTFSAIAYLDRMGFPVTIPNAEGDLITPSAVLFEPDGSVVIGKQALRAAIVQPDRVATCVKRDMGETFYSRIVAGRRWKPQHLAAFILRKLKQDAQRRIGPIRGAVITVPAYYDEARRQATVDAGRIAGLNVVDIINEPTAAALSYAFRKVLEGGEGDAIEKLRSADGTVAVYDLGGGTFDVTIIRQVEHQVNVLATDGDLFLGGRDWDERIVNHVSKQFIEQYGGDPRENPQASQELWRAAEEAKKDLSARQATMFSVSHAGHQLAVSLTRDQFQQMTKDLLYRTESRMVRVLRTARLTWQDINEVLLVGGSSRMPQVPEMVKGLSGRAPNSSLAFDEIVAHGAVVHGAVLQAQGRIEASMTSFASSGSAELPLPQAPPAGFTPDSPRPAPQAAAAAAPLPPLAPAPPPPAPLPLDPQPSPSALAPQPIPAPKPSPAPKPADDIPLCDLPEAEIIGDSAESAPAGPRQQRLTKALKTFKAVNVNAHSLGVVAFSDKDQEELASIIIPRNTPLPASHTKRYGTVRDNQQYILVQIIEGESRSPEACMPVGECTVGPLPHGLPRKSLVTVTFTYDGSGMLHVLAKQTDTGVNAQCTLVRPRAMSEQELSATAELIAQINIT